MTLHEDKHVQNYAENEAAAILYTWKMLLQQYFTSRERHYRTNATLKHIRKVMPELQYISGERHHN